MSLCNGNHPTIHVIKIHNCIIIKNQVLEIRHSSILVVNDTFCFNRNISQPDIENYLYVEVVLNVPKKTLPNSDKTSHHIQKF